MNKIPALALAAMFTFSLAVLDLSAPPASLAAVEKTELVVFAAASMTETMEEVAALYQKKVPGITLTFNFDSSGTLKTQIQEGAECDVFISASPKQMNELDLAADAKLNPKGLDFIKSDTRINLLENRVTLCVPKGNPRQIKNFDDWAAKMNGNDIIMAMGNSDVPVGQYTQKIFQYYNLDEKALAGAGKITYGSNVKEVTVHIKEGSVDCGVVYCTDAYSAGLEILDYATRDMCGQVIYPAAALKASRNPVAAKAFLDYLQSNDARAVFAKVGFSAAQ